MVLFSIRFFELNIPFLYLNGKQIYMKKFQTNTGHTLNDQASAVYIFTKSELTKIVLQKAFAYICFAIFAHALNKRLVMDKCQHLRTKGISFYITAATHTHIPTRIYFTYWWWIAFVCMWSNRTSGKRRDREWLCLRMEKGWSLNQNDA